MQCSAQLARTHTLGSYHQELRGELKKETRESAAAGGPSVDLLLCTPVSTAQAVTAQGA